jgi:enoyl-CoA hydratase/carnithine racemase
MSTYKLCHRLRCRSKGREAHLSRSTTSDRQTLSEVQGRVLVILNRPDARNALDADVSRDLLAAFDRLDADTDLYVGVLSGNGPGFCSGMDRKTFAISGPPAGITQLVRRPTRKPVAAAVEGFALAGGLELALVETGKALGAATELAGKIAANAPLGVAASEQLLLAAPDLSEDEFWRVQDPIFADVAWSDDAKEGLRAFAERREPAWSCR